MNDSSKFLIVLLSSAVDSVSPFSTRIIAVYTKKVHPHSVLDILTCHCVLAVLFSRDSGLWLCAVCIVVGLKVAFAELGMRWCVLFYRVHGTILRQSGLRSLFECYQTTTPHAKRLLAVGDQCKTRMSRNVLRFISTVLDVSVTMIVHQPTRTQTYSSVIVGSQ